MAASTGVCSVICAQVISWVELSWNSRRWRGCLAAVEYHRVQSEPRGERCLGSPPVMAGDDGVVEHGATAQVLLGGQQVWGYR